MVIGTVLLLLATANAIFLGWLGNRGVRRFDPAEHRSFVDFSGSNK